MGGSVIGVVLGLVAGGLGGFVLGRRLKCRDRGWYWLASSGCFFFGVALIFYGALSGAGLLAGTGVGLVTGGLNGIKYGAGRLSEWRGECGPPYPGS
jgi:hypothetical protein